MLCFPLLFPSYIGGTRPQWTSVALPSGGILSNIPFLAEVQENFADWEKVTSVSSKGQIREFLSCALVFFGGGIKSDRPTFELLAWRPAKALTHTVDCRVSGWTQHFTREIRQTDG